MLRQPLFFIFMIAGFFYASVLRPLPLAVVGVAATSVLVNTLIAGLPQNAEAWTFYLAIIGVQTLAIGAGAVLGEKIDRAERGAAPGARPARGGARGERRPPRPAAGPGPRGGRARRAAADGARDPRHDRPGPDRDRHPARGGRAGRATGRPIGDRHVENAERLARESLTEARRSVEASLPGGARGRDACRTRSPTVAREWSELNGDPGRGRPSPARSIALHPEIEVALLRTAQEALANVAQARRAPRARG